MNRHIISAGLVSGMLAAAVPAGAQTFGYLGEIGPDHWAELSADWATCGSGTIQSPVDLGKQRVHRKPQISYSASTGEIFNNGHTIEVETEGNNTLVLDGVVYELSQFHFHTASEHRVGSRGYDMEMHLVHTSAAGTNAVIGVFMKRAPTSGALAPIFENLPDTLNVHEELEDPFNPADFLPKSDAHYRYVGSLTTPPCTEGVQWIVMLEPVTISDEDMAQFASRISFNARFTQRQVPDRPVK